MLPVGFEAAARIGIAAISRLAPDAADLMATLEVAMGAKTPQGAYQRFAGLIRRARPGIGFPDISELYRAAQYFTSPAKYLARYDPDVIIDRRLAAVVKTPTGLGPHGEPVRYGVDVLVTFAGTGESRVFGVWVESDEFRSLSDVQQQAIEKIMARFKPRSRFKDYGGEAENGIVTASITQFQRFTPRSAA